MPAPQLSIVIPTYKSAAIVPNLAQALRDALQDRSYEAIFVNDRSPDKSWEAICNEANHDKQVIGIHLRKNVGQDRAIMAGLSEARGAYVVIMDDDLQHKPSDIPALYDEVIKGYDVCYANFFKKKQSPIKNLYSWVAGKFAERVLHKPPHIYLSPFKIIKKEVVDAALLYKGPFP
ncbi:MAG: glycosyltransferase family 2 protein [Verrucomicrobiota bacterium]